MLYIAEKSVLFKQNISNIGFYKRERFFTKIILQKLVIEFFEQGRLCFIFIGLILGQYKTRIFCKMNMIIKAIDVTKLSHNTLIKVMERIWFTESFSVLGKQ